MTHSVILIPNNVGLEYTNYHYHYTRSSFVILTVEALYSYPVYLAAFMKRRLYRIKHDGRKNLTKKYESVNGLQYM